MVAIPIEKGALYFFAFLNWFAAISAFFLHLPSLLICWLLLVSNNRVYWPTFAAYLLLTRYGLTFLLAVVYA
jgi:hypothetical protein